MPVVQIIKLGFDLSNKLHNRAGLYRYNYKWRIRDKSHSQPYLCIQNIIYHDENNYDEWTHDQVINSIADVSFCLGDWSEHIYDQLGTVLSALLNFSSF